MSDVYSALNEIFRDFFEDPAISLQPQTTAQDIPGWDSFAHINIIVAIESHWNIKFLSTEIEGLQNVGRLVAVIEKKLGA